MKIHRNYYALMAAVVLLLSAGAEGTISFGSTESRILLRSDTNSIFKSTRPAKIAGWKQESIVRGTSQQAANTWAPIIDFNTPYGTSDGGGMTVAPDRLLYATSAAVNVALPRVITAQGDISTLQLDMSNVQEASLRGYNIANKAAGDIIGLRQTIAQNALDIKSTTTSSYALTFTKATNKVNAIAWHPASNLLAVARNYYTGNTLAGGPGTVWAHYYDADFGTIDPLSMLTPEETFVPRCLAWNPAGNMLAVGADDGNGSSKLYFFSQSRSALGTLVDKTSVVVNTTGSAIKDVAWSPNGRYLAVVGKNLKDGGSQQLQIYTLKAYEEGALWSDPGVATYYSYSADPLNGVVNAVSWHPQGGYLALAGGNKGSDQTLPFIDLLEFNDNGSVQTVNLVLGYSDASSLSTDYRAVAWDPTGRYLAYGNVQGVMGVTEFREDLGGLGILAPSTGVFSYSTTTTVNSLAWSPDGNYITFAHNGYDLYSFKDGVGSLVERATGFANPIVDVKWTIDGKHFALAGQNLTAGGVDLALKDVVTDINSSYAPLVRASSAWLARYDDVVKGSSQWISNNDSSIRGTSATVNNLFPIVRGNSQWVTNNDGWIRATSSTVNNIFPIVRGTSQWVYDQYTALGNTSALAQLLRVSSNWINRQVTDAGAFGNSNGSAVIQKQLTTIPNGVLMANPVSYLRWNPANTGQFVAAYGGGPNLTWFQSFTMSNLATTPTGGTSNTNTGLVSAIAWNPAGTRLAIAYGSTLAIYNASLSLVTSTSIGGATISGLSWSPGGTELAVSFNTTQGYVRVYSYSADSLSAAAGDYSCGVGSTARSVSWNPATSSTLLAIIYSVASQPKIDVAAYTAGTPGTVSSTLSSPTNYGSSSNTINAVAWDVAGSYLAVGGDVTAAQGTIYAYATGSPATLTQKATVNTGTSTMISEVSWSPIVNTNGSNSLAFSFGGPASTGGYSWVTFDGTTATVQASVSDFYSAAQTVMWVGDGSGFAVGGTSLAESGANVQPYKNFTTYATYTGLVSSLGTLVRNSSNFINSKWPLIRTTSNWVNAKDALLRTTSNAVNASGGGLSADLQNALVGSSNWVNRYSSVVQGSSQWIVNNDNWLRATSNWVNANGALVRANSNVINMQWPLLRSTSNAVAVLRLDMTTAQSDISTVQSDLTTIQGDVSTLQADIGNISPVVAGTSQWVVNNDSWIRGTSNWVNGKNTLVRTTSNALNAQWLTVRTTSNWINRQFTDLGDSKVGQILRGTSHWIKSQVDRLGMVANLANTQTQRLYDSVDPDISIIRWSPTNNSLFAVAEKTGSPYNRFKLYSYSNATTAPTLTGSSASTGAATPTAMAWNPAGTRFAVAYSNLEAIYNADFSIAIMAPAAVGSACTALAWSPEGDRIAFALGPSVLNYSYSDGGQQDSTTLSSAIGVDYMGSDSIRSLSWNPQTGSTLIAVGYVTPGGNRKVDVICQDSISSMASALAGVTAYSTDSSDTLSTVIWDPTGSYLAVAGSATGKQVAIYKYSATTATTGVLTLVASINTGTGTKAVDVSWSSVANSDGSYSLSAAIAPTSGSASGGYVWATFSGQNQSVTVQSLAATAFSAPAESVAWVGDGSGFVITGNGLSTQVAFSQYATSYAPPVLGALVRGNSNFINAAWPLVRTTSNWVNRYNDVVGGTSQWVNNNDQWLRGTSQSVNNLFTIVRGNSQWIANNDSWIRGTSDWVNAHDVAVAYSSGTKDVYVEDLSYTPATPLHLDNNASLYLPAGCVFDGNNTILRMKRGAANIIGTRGPSDPHVYFTNTTIDPFDPANYTTVKPYFGNGVTLVLNYDVTLDQDLNIYGDVTIQGNNHRLNLADKKVSLTEQGALTLVNCILPDLQGSPLYGARDTNRIVLDNSDLHLTRNLTFTRGGLRFVNDVKITGTSIFSYESSTSSTVMAASRLYLDNNVTFSYSPRSPRNWLFEMSDASAILHFNGASLKTTTTGLNLKAGTVLIDGQTTFYNDGARAACEGIAVGDGTSVNELGIIVMPSASLELKSGILNYANAS